MNIVDIFDEFDGYQGDLSKWFSKFDSAKKDRIIVKMNQLLKDEMERRRKLSGVKPQETTFYTVKEAAALLKVSEQTIHNWKNLGRIDFRKIGGSIRFTLDDLLSFCLKPEPKIESNLAVCTETVIYIDKENQEVVPFEKTKIYKIINENKIWITLYSIIWGQAARFSKKRFRKFFSIADDRQIAQIKYNFKNLS